MANKKKVKKSFLKGEGIIWLTLALILLAIPVCNVYTKAILSETNIELEEVKNDVERQQNTNDSLRTEIYELASLDKIQLVVV